MPVAYRTKITRPATSARAGSFKVPSESPQPNQLSFHSPSIPIRGIIMVAALVGILIVVGVGLVTLRERRWRAQDRARRRLTEEHLRVHTIQHFLHYESREGRDGGSISVPPRNLRRDTPTAAESATQISWEDDTCPPYRASAAGPRAPHQYTFNSVNRVTSAPTLPPTYTAAIGNTTFEHCTNRGARLSNMPPSYTAVEAEPPPGISVEDGAICATTSLGAGNLVADGLLYRRE